MGYKTSDKNNIRQNNKTLLVGQLPLLLLPLLSMMSYERILLNYNYEWLIRKDGYYYDGNVELEREKRSLVYLNTIFNNLEKNELFSLQQSLLMQIDVSWQSTKKAFPISPKIVNVSRTVRIFLQTIYTFTSLVSYFILCFSF
jgi:hypothetical protein